MVNALREYYELVMRPSWGWMKKHWKGYSVYLALTAVISFIVAYWSDIKGYVESKFKKTEEEES